MMHHCHHHGEPHAHNDGKAFEEANKQFFTENIGEFEKPRNIELAKRFAFQIYDVSFFFEESHTHI